MKASMPNRGIGLKEKTLREIDNAIGMAKRMQDKLLRNKKKELKNG